MKQLEMLEKLKENGHSVMLVQTRFKLVWCNNGTPIGLRTAKDNAKSKKHKDLNIDDKSSDQS